MDMGQNLTIDEYWTLHQSFEQSLQTSQGTPLQISAEVETGIKRIIPEMAEAVKKATQSDQVQCHCSQELKALIPDMVDKALKRAIPTLVEETVSRLVQEFKPFIRAMVEEIQSPQKMQQNPSARLSESEGLELHFVGALPDPEESESIFTRNDITDKEGAPLMVELINGSGSRVAVGPGSSSKIKIVVLDGDFELEDKNWTEEYFNKQIVQPRKGKESQLLKGKCLISLIEGVATVSNLSFTDNSSSMRNGNFRLGAQVVKPPAGVVIKEAVSEAFQVKERRVISYGKQKRPSLDHGTCCLKHIGTKSKKKLEDEKIHSVKDFLQLYNTDAKALRNILHGISENTWSKIVNNAKSCLLTKECYFYHDDTKRIDLVLDCVFNIVSVTFPGQNNLSFGTLDDLQKELADEVRRKAYEKRNELQPIFAPTKQTSLQVAPVCPPAFPCAYMHFMDTTAEEQGQPEMLPSFNHPALGVMLPQPGQPMNQTQGCHHENQDLDMLVAGFLSDDHPPHMISTYNAQAVRHGDGEVMTRYSKRWGSLRAILMMLTKVSIKQGPRAIKRPKLSRLETESLLARNLWQP